MKTSLRFMQTHSFPILHTRPVAGNRLCGFKRPYQRLSHVGCLLLALAGLGSVTARASDPIGIYALVDKVVLEPNEAAPERIQIRGAFAIADGSGEKYRTAERGYLYFKINPDKPALCRNEWTDLTAVAGTGQIVSFGARYQDKGTLRKPDAKPENPEVYPLAAGLYKVRGKSDYPPIKQLLKLRLEKSASITGPNAGI